MIGRTTRGRAGAGLVLLVAAVAGGGFYAWRRAPAAAKAGGTAGPSRDHSGYRPRLADDTSGFAMLGSNMAPWKGEDTLAQIARRWERPGYDLIKKVEADLATARSHGHDGTTVVLSAVKASLLNFEGDAEAAYKLLGEVRARAEAREDLARGLLYNLIYLQGVTALRRGENANCVMCRGESSCILPIAPAAFHTRPEGSRDAIRHFTEYLRQFPDDLETRWLLNVAHMTLGEYPGGVDPQYLLSIERFERSEFDIGRFLDVAHEAGVDRENLSGGAILDDFDGDGRLDLVVTDFAPTGPMAYYRNKGDGTFEDRTASSGLDGQLGGLACFQADFDNDGRLDVFVPRGAWLKYPIRPSLLRNVGEGRFVDVTEASGLLDPINAHAACWGDYDNDGRLDLFVACERQTNRLYRNKGDGTFEEVARKAGVAGSAEDFAKGATWIDYDNDDFPDLFINNFRGLPYLFRNRRDGTFLEVTVPMRVDGPDRGFSCWAFDYDNDGWLDLFATCYDRTLADIVKGLVGLPHKGTIGTSRLFHNVGGKAFEDVTYEAGLDQVHAAMGSNFADFDNDGFLDFYLGTGDPSLATIVPNRMFRNVEGKRFAEITGSSRTGHLQKGHGVAIGDFDRDGDVDLFVQTGGAVPGDRYHNVLFRNPGQGHKSLTVKLVGKTTNRSAIGARIKAVTAGPEPMTIYRHVSSGSSFGANPLEQTIGLGKADRLSTLEIHWPTSRTTQVLRDVPAGGVIEITESVDGYRRLDTTSPSHP